MNPEKLVRLMYNNTCVVCGSKSKTIHYIDNNKLNKKTSNIVCVCNECKKTIDSNIEHWKEYLSNKEIILITGSEGMIGKELFNLLKKEFPNHLIRCADIKMKIDLRYYDICISITDGVSDVYSLVGIKGSPKKTAEKPASFLVPMLQFNTNLLEASRINNVKKFLYTSSIAVLNPETDAFPAHAKKTAELQIDAYKIEYPEFGNNCYIVRPANVYGKYDNFNNLEAMVVTSLIRKSILDDVIQVWGDGSEIREFISAYDVARAMVLTMKMKPTLPVNIGSGETHTIKELAEILSKISNKKIQYMKSEQRGGQKRVVFNDVNQSDIGFTCVDDFKESIIQTYNYAKQFYNWKLK